MDPDPVIDEAEAEWPTQSWKEGRGGCTRGVAAVKSKNQNRWQRKLNVLYGIDKIYWAPFSELIFSESNEQPDMIHFLMADTMLETHGEFSSTPARAEPGASRAAIGNRHNVRKRAYPIGYILSHSCTSSYYEIFIICIVHK